MWTARLKAGGQSDGRKQCAALLCECEDSGTGRAQAGTSGEDSGADGGSHQPEQVSQISGYLDTWENVSFDDKRRVVDLMITTIAATSDSLNITWKI